MATAGPHLLTDGEAAERLRMIPSRLVRLAKAGAIPSVVFPDGVFRFLESDLEQYVQAHRRNGEASA